ncbi:hypothetical protein [Herbiconiux liangxiaofengii]|uniref:hypothetical protein n=1 Tax=Herbiconiux liangxiaofengii TaxID=3342795 RepID=UPI0035B789C0
MHTLTPSRKPASRRLAALGLTAAAALTLLIAGPAATASASPVSCWTNLDTGATGCFDASVDPVDAIENATGRPVVAETTGPAAARGAGEATAAPAAAAVDYLLLTAYDNTGLTGPSNSYFTSNTNICTNGYAYGFTNFGTFNDRFESFQSYNGCSATFFANSNYTGAEYGPYVSRTTMGTFNNTASSVYVGQ